jgi:hypothetical protein
VLHVRKRIRHFGPLGERHPEAHITTHCEPFGIGFSGTSDYGRRVTVTGLSSQQSAFS